MQIIDSVPAHTLEVGDLALVEGDQLEVTSIDDTDPDTLVVSGYSHDDGGIVDHPVPAFDLIDLWSA